MYAWNFYQLPYGILAVALATAVFTELSESAGKHDMAEFKQHLSHGLRTTGVLILPSAAALAVLARPLVSLYRAGAFSAEAVAPVSSALRFWSVTLIFYAAMMFVLRAFYSLKDTLTPALVNLVMTVVQVALYWALTTGFGAWPGLGINGIPIADAIFYVSMLIALVALLRKKIGAFDLRSVVATFVKMSVASLCGGAAAYGIALFAEPLAAGVTGSLLAAGSGGAMCFAVALGVGAVLGVEEVRSVAVMGKRLLSKKRP